MPHGNGETDDMKKRAIDGKLSIPSPGNAAKADQPTDGALYFPSFSLAS